MPNVHFRYSKKVLPSEVELLSEGLTRFVAEALSTSSTLLKANEVAVMPEQLSELALNTKDVDVTILANDNPERKNTLKERQDYILKELCGAVQFLGKKFSVGVYVLLAEGSYGETS